MSRDAMKEFIAEGEELLESFHRDLVKIDDSLKEKSRIPPELINSVFRAAHTLKGMSAMVGLRKISELAHKAEDLLDRLRMGRMELSGEAMLVLFEGAEVLRKGMELARVGKGEEVQTEPLLKRIEGVLSGGESKKEGDPLASLEIDPDLMKVLTQYETHRLSENVKAGSTIFEVIARFSLETFDKKLMALTARLASRGEVITTLPCSGGSPEDGIEFRILVGTRTEKTAFSSFLGPGFTLREVCQKGTPPLSAPPSSPKSATPEMRESVRSLSESIRVDVSKLDRLLDLIGELVLQKVVISEIGRELVAQQGFRGVAADLVKATQTFGRKVTELQEEVIDVRMIPVDHVFEWLTRVVRKLSRDLGKEVDLEMAGGETKLDKSMAEQLADPLLHIIRNALDHGLESREERKKAGKREIGWIRLSAIQQGNTVRITVEDDGRGIDLEKVKEKGRERGLIEKEKEYTERDLLALLFLPGFSTSETVTELSGRGVGLDVVAKNIGRLSGLIDVETERGTGTRFTITLPLTLLIIKALIVTVGPEIYAIPLSSVSESLVVDPSQIQTINKKEVIQVRGHTLALVRVRDLFQIAPDSGQAERLYVIIVGVAEKKIGLIVDSIYCQQEVVIKPIGGGLQDIPGIAGATELGNRKTILILDVAGLIEEAVRSTPANTLRDR